MFNLPDSASGGHGIEYKTVIDAGRYINVLDYWRYGLRI